MAKTKDAAEAQATKETKKVAAPAKTEAKTEASQPKKAAKTSSSSEIRVRLIGSPIRRDSRQREYIKALGLRKLGSEKVLADSPSVRGLLKKAEHMVKIVG